MSEPERDVTLLLARVGQGDSDVRDRLFRVVEAELRKIANHLMQQQRSDHSLQPTVLMDDAFLKLVGSGEGVAWENRTHFYRAAARAIRHILVDHERGRRAQKRGAGKPQQSLIAADEIAGPSSNIDLLALNEALNKLSQLDPRQCDIVDLHHFGGYTQEETAGILGLSKSTVKLEWSAAKAWLHKELSCDDEES